MGPSFIGDPTKESRIPLYVRRMVVILLSYELRRTMLTHTTYICQLHLSLKNFRRWERGCFPTNVIDPTWTTVRSYFSCLGKRNICPTSSLLQLIQEIKGNTEVGLLMDRKNPSTTSRLLPLTKWPSRAARSKMCLKATKKAFSYSSFRKKWKDEEGHQRSSSEKEPERRLCLSSVVWLVQDL